MLFIHCHVYKVHSGWCYYFQHNSYIIEVYNTKFLERVGLSLSVQNKNTHTPKLLFITNPIHMFT